jgi:hypothetical protein
MLSPDLSNVQRALGSSDWSSLRAKLFQYIQNYSYKVIATKGGFQF